MLPLLVKILESEDFGGLYFISYNDIPGLIPLGLKKLGLNNEQIDKIEILDRSTGGLPPGCHKLPKIQASVPEGSNIVAFDYDKKILSQYKAAGINILEINATNEAQYTDAISAAADYIDDVDAHQESGLNIAYARPTKCVLWNSSGQEGGVQQPQPTEAAGGAEGQQEVQLAGAEGDGDWSII
jgi:hypothetical protein